MTEADPRFSTAPATTSGAPQAPLAAAEPSSPAASGPVSAAVPASPVAAVAIESLDVETPDPDASVLSAARPARAANGKSPAPQPADNSSAPRSPLAPAAFTPDAFAPASSAGQADTAIRPAVVATGEAKDPQRPAAGADASKAEAAARPAAAQVPDPASPQPDPAVAVVQPAAPAPAEPAVHSLVGSTDQTATPPAAQLGSILVASTRTQGGNQQLTVRLDPPELGRVQIAIAQPGTGAAAVTLTVERPETLLMVLRDAPALHQALDRAGIPAEARTVAFQLAPQHEPSPQQPHGQGSQPGPAFDLGSRDQWQRPTRQMPQRNEPGAGSAAADEASDNQPAYARIWQRAGIDITA